MIEITSKRGNAVLMSAEEYAAWQKTAYLFRSPANARRLLDAADAAQRGDRTEHPLERVRLVFAPQGWEDYTH